MSFRTLIFVLLLLLMTVMAKYHNPNKYESESCSQKIYHDCHHATQFTDEEVDIARVYMQDRFRGSASIAPLKPACRKLRVRKNFKCMSTEERAEVIDVFKKLYENGAIERLARIHTENWDIAHKTSEGLIWHRWLNNQMELEMIKVNPNVALPYWDFTTDFAAPDRSVIWEWFGRAGSPANDFCIADGPFANLTVQYPTPHCVRRHWGPDGQIYTWESPEWMTSLSQRNVLPDFAVTFIKAEYKYCPDSEIFSAKNLATLLAAGLPNAKVWGQYILFTPFTCHFKPHHHIGGWEGDMSVAYANNDPVFYLVHNYQSDYTILKRQLSDDESLVPLSYDVGIRIAEGRTDKHVANIRKDILTYFHVPIPEVFQVGFGELCYTYDSFIKPINAMVRGQTFPLPATIGRLHAALPDHLFKQYFPKLARNLNNISFFDYIMTDVGDDCNSGLQTGICNQIPAAPPFRWPPAGERTWQRVAHSLDFDITPLVRLAESHYYKFIEALNKYNYCSPYAV